MTSPVKSLSVRENADGSVCMHKKIKPGIYEIVADFWFEIEMFVKFIGTLNTSSGYILKKILKKKFRNCWGSHMFTYAAQHTYTCMFMC